MKDKTVKKIVVTSGILLFCYMFIVVACNTGSKRVSTDTKQPAGRNDEATTFDEDTPPDQLIVWRKPGKTRQEVEKWLDYFRRRHGNVSEKYSCGSCDNSLMLLFGPGVKTYIQTESVKGQVTAGSQSPTTGEDGPVFYSRNYRVRHKKPYMPRITSVERPSPVNNLGRSVKVAVFDTGIEPGELSNYAYNYSGSSCIAGAESGWNFIKQNRDYRDDNDIKHGTIVTRFITDQVVKAKRNRIEVLPVKTHDANGISDLFNVLCAFAYAKEMGVQVVNASFGFYVPRRMLSPEDDPYDPNVLLLRKYIEHYLTKNNILLITAAGNSDKVNLRRTFEEHGRPYRPTDPRDLNQVSFYPASLARNPDFANVIAVTTVFINKGKGSVSPDQNFSKDVVDIGVMADGASKDDYVFNNPLLNKNETVNGSSFAAPIVTGIICANYDRIKTVINRKGFKKDDIWKELGSQFVSRNETLTDKIKGGKVIVRL
ncbi:MAG: S8 family serine peptidase [Chitinophagaceae bacterium]